LLHGEEIEQIIFERSLNHPVGQKKANAWGLYDMHGNVKQWCNDWFSDLPQADSTDPRGPDRGEGRVVRGGGTNDVDMRLCRSAARDYLSPEKKGSNVSFRVVTTPD
jgi:formylglycine-generating enzyme required for sulfatase activity